MEAEETASAVVNDFAPLMSREEYDADTAYVRSTSLKYFLEPQGPAAYYWHCMTPDPDRETSVAMALGTIVHLILLDGKPESSVFAVPPMRRDRRTKDYQAWLLANPGVIPLSDTEAKTVRGMVAGVARNKQAIAYLVGQHSFQEQTILWTHQKTGILAKARLDMLGMVAPHDIVDLKSTQSTCEWAFVKDFDKFKYWFSLAFYEQARDAVIGRKASRGSKVSIIAVSSKHPHWCYIHEVSDQFMFMGHKAVNEAFARLALCRQDQLLCIQQGRDISEAYPDDEAVNQGVLVPADYMQRNAGIREEEA